MKTHSSVDSKTQLAESSVSVPYISAIFETITAEGVALSITALALKEKGRGRKYTVKKQNSGKSKSFESAEKYTKGRQNSGRRGTVASRAPKISIQSGVDILPTSEMLL